MLRYYTPRVSLICAHCGAPFDVIASRARTAEFCSRPCRYQAGRMQVVCACCGRALEIAASRLSRDHATRYCSMRCKGIGSRQTLAQALAVATDKTGDCWLITTSLSNGYGRVGYYDGPGGSRYIAAHHAAWVLASGEPVPKGQQINHVCDVRNCVRNDDEGVYVVDGVPCRRFGHLFLGTAHLNMVDRSDKGRASTVVGEESHLSKVTDDIVREIRRRYAAGGISQRRLASEYGITHATLQSLIHRRTWAHVD